MKMPLFVLMATLVFNVAWAADAASPSLPTLTGEVLEVRDAGGYTYLRLKTADGEIWAAVNAVPATKGDKVTIFDPMEMQDFESKALQRRFPTIVFGTVGAAVPAGQVASTPPGTAASPHGDANLGAIQGGGAKPTDVIVAKVAKADGPTGRTVAEVNTQRGALKDKPVTIRATVVKVNASVMGKNWVHLRDGSGSAAEGSNDLLVTSKDAPKVGDVVIASGVVKTDVDFGSGYAYKVLVEDASFKR